jgi:hypothetical protein
MHPFDDNQLAGGIQPLTVTIPDAVRMSGLRGLIPRLMGGSAKCQTTIIPLGST